MRLLVLSDLHLELDCSYAMPEDVEYDAVVLAGDIHSPGRKAVHWARRDSTFGGKPVVLVAGNHEFYGCELHTELAEMRKAAEGSNVHLLDRSVVVIAGVRFVGCMLWSDFQLPIRQPDGSTEVDVGRALVDANQYMNDFRLIEVQAPAKRQNRDREFRRLLRAEDTLAMHWVDRDWLRRELANPFDGPTVAVTHHAPAGKSVAERYATDWLTPAFVSELPDEFFDKAAVWVHGHTHSPFDYQRGRCRVVSNSRGYRLEDGSFENHRFDAGFMVELRDGAEQMLAPQYQMQDHRVLQLAEADLAGRADMVGLEEAAQLAGVTRVQLCRWAALKRPRVIALQHPRLGLRLPRWQFDANLWPVVQQLAQALQAGGASALAWMETPLGALGGRAPRAALEQGELADRVLALAASEGL